MGEYYLPWLIEESDLPPFYDQIKEHRKEDVAAVAQSTLEEKNHKVGG